MKDIKINGKQYKLRESKFKIKDLLYNPFNTRIYDYIKTNKELREFNENGDIGKLSNLQSLIYERLKESSISGENDDITKSIKRDGIQGETLITKDGILISGNNRISIVNYLIEKGQWNHSDEINVLIFEDDLTKEDILLLELEVQNVLSKQLKYDMINNIRRAYQLIEEGHDVDRALELTNLNNFNKRYVYNFEESIIQISEFFEVHNIIEFTFGEKLYSWLDFYANTVFSSKYKSKIEVQRNIKKILNNIILFASNNIQFLDFRNTFNKLVAPNQSIVTIEEFADKTKSIYSNITKEFIEYLKSDKENKSLKTFKEESKELVNINKIYCDYLDETKARISGFKKQVKDSKKNIFNLDLSKVSKTEENIKLAKDLMEEIEKWLNQ